MKNICTSGQAREIEDIYDAISAGLEDVLDKHGKGRSGLFRQEILSAIKARLEPTFDEILGRLDEHIETLTSESYDDGVYEGQKEGYEEGHTEGYADGFDKASEVLSQPIPCPSCYARLEYNSLSPVLTCVQCRREFSLNSAKFINVD